MSGKKGRKLSVLPSHTELASDVFAVRLHRFRRYPESRRDFLGAVPRPDKTADIEFRKRQSGHSLLSAVRASSRLPQHTAYLILY